jgi:sporulation protein YlmC with PRC-barrel domain
MNKLLRCGVLAALGMTGVVLAQTPGEDPRTPDPRSYPATSPTDGSAADRTQPGQTQPRERAGDRAMDPRPATSPAEGTAADRTAPGNTRTRTPEGVQTQQGAGGIGDLAPEKSELVGTQVVSQSNAQLGSVVDVVLDGKGQPAFVVIESKNNTAAVPYNAASTMMKGDKFVVDQRKLEGAPKVKQGEWRSKSSGSWKSDAAKYWGTG